MEFLGPLRLFEIFVYLQLRGKVGPRNGPADNSKYRNECVLSIHGNIRSLETLTHLASSLGIDSIFPPISVIYL